MMSHKTKSLLYFATLVIALLALNTVKDSEAIPSTDLVENSIANTTNDQAVQ